MTRALYSFAMVAAFSLTPASFSANPPSSLPNPFYAMDTGFTKPGTTLEQQLDLVKELGFAGIAWHEGAPDKVKVALDAAEQRGLKMFTIYCAAQVSPEGDLRYSPDLARLMEVLKGHGTIVWLHIGGKGPAFSSMTADDAVVKKLRALSDQAAANDLRIAIYPHLGEWTARFADATRLAKLVNHKAFGVSFNLCHALAAGEEAKIPDLLQESKPVLFTATISGADSGVTSNWNKLIQTLDKGTYDVGIVLRKFKEIGFTGSIGFQGYGIPGDARSILTPTMAGWRKLSAVVQAQ